jgi:hypothetical protein
MGDSSQAGQVLFRTQSVPGVFAADFAAEHIAMKLRGGSLVPNRELLVTDPEIGGGRDTVDAYLGGISWAGDYEFYARMESLPTLLAAAFGSHADAVQGTGAWKHTITPLDSATLPLLSVEEKIGSGLETFNYNDCVVNTFHLEAEANGYLMGTAGLIGKKGIAGATPTATPSWDDSNLIVGTNINVTLGGVGLAAKSFAFDLNNNFEDDDFRLGSFYIGDLTAKSREVSGSFSLRPTSSADWRRATFGSAAATEAGGLSSKQALIIDASTYEDIAGSTPLIKRRIVLTINNIILEPYGLEPSGDDIIENDVSWRAVRPVAGTPIATVDVYNGLATVA